MRGPFLAALAVSACTQSGLESTEPLAIRLRVPPDIVAGSSLRSAVVFTLKGGPAEYVVVDDVRVDTSSSTADVELSLPEKSTLARATPIARLKVDQRVRASAFRPRLVVYDDEDENGRFTPDLSGDGAADRLLAIDEDDQGYAAILDLPRLLEELPLDDAEVFYEATGGHYTPFVFTYGTSDLTLWSAPATVPVFFDPALAKASFECRRNVYTAVGMIEQDIVLDEGVPTELCELGNGDCRVTALGAVEPPDVPSGTYCRSDPEFEALIALASRTACDGCTCTRDTLMRVWIASKDALPRGWPCGREAYSCREDAKLTLSLGCEPA